LRFQSGIEPGCLATLENLEKALNENCLSNILELAEITWKIDFFNFYTKKLRRAPKFCLKSVEIAFQKEEKALEMLFEKPPDTL